MDFLCFLFQPFLFMAKIGKKFEIRILVAIMIVLNLFISGSFPKDKGDPLSTFELESLNTQSPSSVISEVDDGFTYEICSESKIDVTENFSLKHVNLDSEDIGANPCSFSENQWIAIEERISLTSDSEGSNCHPTKRFEGSEELQSVIGALSSTIQEYPTTIEPHNYEIKQPEASIKHIKNHVFDNVDSCDISEENNNLEIASNDVNFFKNYNWTSIILIILLLDGMISFIGKKVEIGVGVMTTIILGYGIPGLIESNMPAFPWFDFPILMYLIAYFLMVLSLILQCALRKEWLSYLVIGWACTCSIFGILCIIVSILPSEYAFACIGVLIHIVVYFVCGVIRDGVA